MKKIKMIFTLFLFAQAGTAALAQEQVAQDTLMALSLEELMNIDITVASKKAEKISDAAGVISVITNEELERFGGVTLRDVLERVPSLISTKASYIELTGMAVRGEQVKGNSGHILILINGRPIREILEGSLSSDVFAAFPVNVIERIEVIRGPGSVLYGTNAFSSVINVVTKVTDEHFMSISALGGPDGTKGINGNGMFSVGDVKVALAGRHMDKGERPINYKIANTTDPSNPTNYLLNLRDKSTSAFADIQYKKLRGTFLQDHYEASHFNNTNNALQNGGAENTFMKRFGNIGYGLSAAKNWDMDINATATYAVFETDPSTAIVRRSTDVVGEWTNHITLNQSARIVAGALYNYNKGYSTVTGNVTSDLNRGALAVYSQLDYWVIKTLKLIGGFQANKVDGIDLKVVPRAGAVWYPISNLSVKALYGQAFRAPTLYETDVDSPYLVGNPDLKPEGVTSVDMGVSYQGGKFQVGANYFRNKQTNIISSARVTTGETRLVYQNLGAITFEGVELEGKYYILNNLFFTGSALYQQNVNNKDVWSTTNVSSYGAKAGLSYEWSKGLTVSLFNVYQGKPGNIYKPIATTVSPAAKEYNVLNLYASLDMFKVFNWNKKHSVALFVQGDNILDSDVWIPSSGTTVATTYPLNVGRTVYIGLKGSL
jgi:outer membrane receptor for ferrienterochelin and colicins